MNAIEPIDPVNAELARRGLRMSIVFGARRHERFPDGLPWACTLYYGRRRMTVVHYTEPGLEREPTAVEVLASLLEDARGYERARGFVDFCLAFGFPRDGWRSEWTYAARRAAARKLRHVLGDEYVGMTSLSAIGQEAPARESRLTSP